MAGEAEGLKISLTPANSKLIQADVDADRRAEAVKLQDAVTSLDDGNIALLVTATQHASGKWPEKLGCE